MCNAGVAAPKKGGRTMYAAEHKVEVTWSLTRELEFVPLCHATCNKNCFCAVLINRLWFFLVSLNKKELSSPQVSWLCSKSVTYRFASRMVHFSHVYVE